MYSIAGDVSLVPTPHIPGTGGEVAQVLSGTSAKWQSDDMLRKSICFRYVAFVIYEIHNLFRNFLIPPPISVKVF